MVLQVSLAVYIIVYSQLPSLHAPAAQPSRAAVRLPQYTSPHTTLPRSLPSAWKCARPRLQYTTYPREAQTARSSSRSHHDLISARASVEYQLVERVWVTATRTLRAAGTWVDRSHRLCLDHAQGRRARTSPRENHLREMIFTQMIVTRSPLNRSCLGAGRRWCRQ